MIITKLLTLVNQLKIYHWQTNSYAQHQAFGKIYDSISDLMDEYVEIFMGKYGKVKNKNGFDIKLKNIEDEDFYNFIDEFCNLLVGEFVQNLDKEKDTDLLNLRDEILSQLNKLKYLLTLE